MDIGDDMNKFIWNLPEWAHTLIKFLGVVLVYRWDVETQDYEGFEWITWKTWIMRVHGKN